MTNHKKQVKQSIIDTSNKLVELKESYFQNQNSNRFENNPYFGYASKKITYQFSRIGYIISYLYCSGDLPFDLKIPERFENCIEEMTKFIMYNNELIQELSKYKVNNFKQVPAYATKLDTIYLGMKRTYPAIDNLIDELYLDLTKQIKGFTDENIYRKRIVKFLVGASVGIGVCSIVGCILMAVGISFVPLTGGLSILLGATGFITGAIITAYIVKKKAKEIEELINVLTEAKSILALSKSNLQEFDNTITLRNMFVKVLFQSVSPYTCCIETCGNYNNDRDIVCNIVGQHVNYFCKDCINGYLLTSGVDPILGTPLQPQDLIEFTPPTNESDKKREESTLVQRNTSNHVLDIEIGTILDLMSES